MSRYPYEDSPDWLDMGRAEKRLGGLVGGTICSSYTVWENQDPGRELWDEYVEEDADPDEIRTFRWDTMAPLVLDIGGVSFAFGAIKFDFFVRFDSTDHRDDVWTEPGSGWNRHWRKDAVLEIAQVVGRVITEVGVESCPPDARRPAGLGCRRHRAPLRWARELSRHLQRARRTRARDLADHL